MANVKFLAFRDSWYSCTMQLLIFNGIILLYNDIIIIRWMRAGWDAALKIKPPIFPCQTRAPSRDMSLLALVLFNIVINDLNNRI